MRILVLLTVAHTFAWGQTAADGQALFQTRCTTCHGTDGNGGEHAPSILTALATKGDDEVSAIIREGVPRKGMPAFKQLAGAEVRALIGHMRSLQQPRRGAGVEAHRSGCRCS